MASIFNKGSTGQADEPNAPQPVSTQPSPQAMSSTDNAVSTIANDMKITGDVVCSGVIRIEGQVEGSVKGARQVLIGRQGLVKGDVNAREAVIGGKIEGSVSVSERVEIQGTALINGDIMAKSMLVQEGGRINGAIRMEEMAGPASRPRELRESRESHAPQQPAPVAVVR